MRPSDVTLLASNYDTVAGNYEHGGISREGLETTPIPYYAHYALASFVAEEGIVAPTLRSSQPRQVRGIMTSTKLPRPALVFPFPFVHSITCSFF